MNTQQIKQKVFFWISCILLFIQSQNDAFASHAQSADITYKCLGGNNYQISLSFYRDCAGVAAPTSVTIDLNAASCGQSLTATLNQIPGTGIEVSPICSSMNTVCTGGSYPGVQQYIYRGVVALPDYCTDWVFSFSLCCRNASIGTIVAPSSDNIYVEAHLDNLNFSCNSSPTFSNPPVPFVCVGQSYCYNNGSYDIDGDSLSYTLITPETSASTTVTYIAPYSASQPLLSSPLVTFNNVTGDMCMTPTALEVTVFAVLVQEWRGGMLVGSVMRDIQMRTITCTNNNPYANGINNTGTYTLTSCAGVPINFTIPSFDIDSAQNVTIVWNSGISGASFTSSGASRPVGSFSWTPTTADISTASHCFTVTVQDDNCPYTGSQTYSFCITVTGMVLSTTTTNSNCSAPNGSALVQVVSGTGPFTYQWLPTGGTTSLQTSLASGTYTVNVTGSGGCTSTATAIVTAGPPPANIVINSTNVSCYGANNGSAIANVSGGLAPYIYSWSTGAGTSSINTLAAGTYSFTVTTSNGCVSNASVIISQPLAPLTYVSSQTNIPCYGSSNGSASVVVAGGTGPYTYSWNTSPVQTTSSATNLPFGNYSVIITDASGCTATSSITITEPPALSLSAAAFPVTCNGACNGQTVVIPAGGTPTYSYQWMPGAIPGASATGLCPGTYTVTVTDANACMVNSALTVTEPTAVVVSATGSTTICLGQTTALSSSASGGAGGYTYTWPSVGTGANQNVNPTTPTNYSVTATDANGCSSNTATVSVNVTSLTAANITVSGASAICFGNSTVISSNVFGSTGPVTINWSSGLGSGNGPFTVSPTSTITYTVTVTDACSNSVTATIPVTVNPLPVINLSPQTGEACKEVNLNFTDNSTTNSGASYNWDFGDGTNSMLTNPTHIFSSSGMYNVSVVVTSIYGCTNTANTTCTVIVHPGSIAKFSSQGMDGTTISPIYQFNNEAVNAATWSWNFGDGATSTIQNPTHGYAQKGQYAVTLYTSSDYGCLDSLTQTIEIVPVFTIYIPNAFTPNGDNLNDYFSAKGAEIDEFEMKIFDRWGELIFETNNIGRGWDGTANHGSKMSENGVYVYKIAVRDFEHRYHDYTGSVTLLASE